MNIKLLWLAFEAAIFILLTMYSIMLYWLFTPYYISIKMIMTFMALLILHNIFKGYIWTRHTLIMEETK